MKNPTDHPIHPLLASRWSPYSFDPAKSVDANTLRRVFEAARWSMSSYNAQPWRYIVANRSADEALWNNVLEVLLAGNRPWAEYAPVLAIGLVIPNFEYNGKPNSAAFHDLGAASACLTLEAASHNLMVHQMSGIDPDKAMETFELDDTVIPLTALAIGYAGDNSTLENEYVKRDARKRERKPLSEIIIRGSL